MDDDPRDEMPVYEFDAVDFFLNQPGRSAPRPPILLAYLDSGLAPQSLADRLEGMLAALTRVLADTVAVPMRPSEAEWFVVGQGERGRPWDSATAPALADALRTGRLLWFGVRFLAADFLTEDEPRTWYLNGWCVPDHHPEHHTAAVQLSLVPSRALWPAERVDIVAQRLLGLIEEWTPELDLRTACVTRDRAGAHQSPYDLWYGLDHMDTSPLTRERVRGYYWANLLTAGHLHRLGGLESLRNKATATGCRLRVLAAAGSAPPAVLLLAPGPITAFNDGQLAAMKELLAPVLIRRRYTIYQGYPLRIVPDPGTAFRRVPPGAPMPRLLPPDDTSS
jgi:hypothetical protein